MSDPTIAATPPPPYVAVIFTSVRTDGDDGYAAMAATMERLAREQPRRWQADDVLLTRAEQV